MTKYIDEIFESALEKDFLPDLVMIADFKRRELSEREKQLLDFLKWKYERGCPSKFYSDISKPLQRKYDFFHKVISEFIYN